MENLIIYAFIYLLGSIPFGLILAKFFAKTDIKKEGSKSIGATNVLRVVKEKNPKLAKKTCHCYNNFRFCKSSYSFTNLEISSL